MKKHILIFGLLWTSIVTFGQNYKTAGGIRIGNEIGLTVQQFIQKHQTIELMLSSGIRTKDARLDLLWEDHYPMLGRRFNAYYGIGIHFARPSENNSSFVKQRGLVGVLGGELALGKYLISADVKPIVNFSAGSSQYVFEFMPAVSVRYIFVKRENLLDRIERKIKHL
jgi:hypothetical protein